MMKQRSSFFLYEAADNLEVIIANGVKVPALSKGSCSTTI